MSQQKDLAVEAAKMAIKQAAQKALISAASAIAPYVGIGCLIVLGFFLIIIVGCIIFVVLLYTMCNYAPTTIKFASWVSGILPGDLTTAKALSILGPICDTFKR